MKTVFKFLGIITIAALIGFTVTSCDDGKTGDHDNNIVQEFTVTAGDFQSMIESIKTKPGVYVINLTGDLIDFPGIDLDTAGVSITVKGTGNNKITLKHEEIDDPLPLFKISAGKLILEDINLTASDTTYGDYGLLQIIGGTIEMKDGVTLINKYNETSYRSGVLLSGGTFIMSGGIITECTTGILTTDANGASIIISGGEISNNKENGFLFWESVNSELTISGGEITGNDCAIDIYGDENNVVISGGTINRNLHGIIINGTKIIITLSGGEICNNERNGILFWESVNSELTITGGKINSNEYNGVQICNIDPNYTGNIVTLKDGQINGNGHQGILIAGKENSAIIEGGSISDNERFGIRVETENVLTIKGGQIKDNKYNGIHLDGNGIVVDIEDGKISGNKWNGIQIDGVKNIITVSGGEISGNKDNGIILWESESCELIISGGQINRNEHQGIGINGTGHVVSISGGIISSNKEWGVTVAGKNTVFEKKKGSLIYGKNAGDNSNVNGAMTVNWSLNRDSNADINDEFTIKTDASGNIINSSGNWDK